MYETNNSWILFLSMSVASAIHHPYSRYALTIQFPYIKYALTIP